MTRTTLRRILLLCLLFWPWLPTTHCIPKPENPEDAAACTIRDQLGRKLVMRYESGELPYGVNYQFATDTLKCLDAHSCQGWTIAGCTAVHCREYHACHGTTFLMHNQGVACWGPAACQGAQFAWAHDITCGAGYRQACTGMHIQHIDGQLWCYGPLSCVSGGASSSSSSTAVDDGATTNTNEDTDDTNYDQYNGSDSIPDASAPLDGPNHKVKEVLGAGAGGGGSVGAGVMTVNVGSQGYIRCGNAGSIGQWSCQHLLVEIAHASRACFGTEQNPQRCAVVCETTNDCDHDTIQFKVVPERPSYP
ncbi:hypothetical protein ACA910_011206 [Epithemia clementina (nom. ined.)]